VLFRCFLRKTSKRAYLDSLISIDDMMRKYEIRIVTIRDVFLKFLTLAFSRHEAKDELVISEVTDMILLIVPKPDVEKIITPS